MQVSIMEFAKQSPSLYATKRDGRAIPVWLRGRPGQAKSSVVENGVKAFLMKAYDCPVDVITDMPAQRDAPDYRGYLVPTKMASGNPISVYTKPDLLTRVENSPAFEGGIVVLFLDEIMQADHLTQKVLTDLILNGRLGEFQLPTNVWIICASNYQEDGAGVNRALTILTNRMTSLDVHLPFASWKKYATKQGLPTSVVDFAEFRQDLAFANAVPSKEGPFPTPRSLTDAARYLKQRTGSDGTIPTDEFTKSLVAGQIGEAAMVEMFAYVADAAELPKLSEIIKDPEQAKCPDYSKMSAQYAASQLLLRCADATNINQLWVYAERLLKDMQVKIANDLLNNNFGGVLFNAPRFTKWLAENRSLVSSSFL